MPQPNDRCGLGSRSIRNSCGSSNTSGSRLAAGTTARPCRRRRPRARRSGGPRAPCGACRRPGVTKRNISSTAGVDQLRVGDDPLPRARVLVQRERPARDQVPRRLVAGRDDHDVVRGELLPGQRPVVLRAVGEHAHEVVLGLLAALRGQPLEVGHDLVARLGQRRARRPRGRGPSSSAGSSSRPSAARLAAGTPMTCESTSIGSRAATRSTMSKRRARPPRRAASRPRRRSRPATGGS